MVKIQSQGPRIAILSRAMFSYHSRVLWGFLQKIDSNPGINWRPSMFFCKEPHVNSMQAQMKEIVTEKYDLILSIGALYSKVAADYIREHGVAIPLVFCGVSEPVQLGVVQQLTCEQGITGIMREQLPATYLADFLLFIKPSIKRVLIPYFPTGRFGFETGHLQKIAERFKSNAVDALLVPVYSMTDVVPLVMSHIGLIDTLILPEGTFISDLTSVLARVCGQYKVTLVSHHREDFGANPAITFTQTVEVVGHVLFERAREILLDKKTPEELPILVLPNDRQIIIDMEACHEQGVDLDAIALLCSYNNIIVRNT